MSPTDEKIETFERPSSPEKMSMSHTELISEAKSTLPVASLMEQTWNKEKRLQIFRII